MSFEKYLRDELGIYDGVKNHDMGFLELCVNKLKRRSFSLEDIIRKDIDRKYIIYAYLGRFGLPSTEAPPLEHRIKLLKIALARMVEEELVWRFTTQKDGHVYYWVTDECVETFKKK